jgi:L-alanine-DL-glutamate epimerase-like enolase superfamily enzyme
MASTMTGSTLRQLIPRAYQVPTDAVESDGTLEWSATGVIVVEATAGSTTGLGYAYGDRAAADVIARVLTPAIAEVDVMDIARAHIAMQRAVRNIGRAGIASTAVSAVDTALWGNLYANPGGRHGPTPSRLSLLCGAACVPRRILP